MLLRAVLLCFLFIHNFSRNVFSACLPLQIVELVILKGFIIEVTCHVCSILLTIHSIWLKGEKSINKTVPIVVTTHKIPKISDYIIHKSDWKSLSSFFLVLCSTSYCPGIYIRNPIFVPSF